MTNVLILAGGDGSRLVGKGKGFPKALIWIGDKPVVERLIDQIRQSAPDARIWVVTKEDWRLFFGRWIQVRRPRSDIKPFQKSEAS